MKLIRTEEEALLRGSVLDSLRGVDADLLRKHWGSDHCRQEYRGLGTLGMLELFLGGLGEDIEDSPTMAAIVAECLGARAVLSPLTTSVVLAGTVLHGAGRLDAVVGLVGGDSVAAFAHAEGPMWLADPRAELTATGGGYRLSGGKRFVEYAADAESLVVSALREGQLALVQVPSAATGVRLQERKASGGGRLYDVELDRVELGSDALLATREHARELLELAQRRALLAQAGYLLGSGAHMLELTVAHSILRHQFGRPVGAFQATQHHLADCKLELEMARVLVYAAAQAGPSASLPRLAETKARVADAVGRIGRWAHQIHGGIAVVDDHELSLHYRRTLGETSLYGSPPELWDIAARDLELAVDF